MFAGARARATQHIRATRGLRPNQYISIVAGWAAICPSHSLSFGYVARCVPPTENAVPSNLTRESATIRTFDPAALILATELALVWIRSPGNTAEERGTVLPFNHAVPLA